ncbi:MAG: HU family DNA-binding protein [Clostridiales bacterium]|nr:HU family DNA-binding protein [Clostridiales bacterium]
MDTENNFETDYMDTDDFENDDIFLDEDEIDFKEFPWKKNAKDERVTKLKYYTTKHVLSPTNIATKISRQHKDLQAYSINHILDIIDIYWDEVEKALANGEKVRLGKIGVLSPFLHVPLLSEQGKFDVDTDMHYRPHTELRLFRSKENRKYLDSVFLDNIQAGYPALGKYCKCKPKQIYTLIRKDLIDPYAITDEKPEYEEEQETPMTVESLKEILQTATELTNAAEEIIRLATGNIDLDEFYNLTGFGTGKYTDVDDEYEPYHPEIRYNNPDDYAVYASWEDIPDDDEGEDEE